MKVIFTCGGTAGHVNPALALAQYMQERIENLDILFVGTPDGMERGLVEQAGYAFRGVEVGGFCRSLAPSGIRHNLKSVEHLLAAKGRVRAILRDFPATIEELAECSPVYEELDGFDGDLSGCRSFDELPESCKKYIAELERLCECPITMVGVGPSREHNLERI